MKFVYMAKVIVLVVAYELCLGIKRIARKQQIDTPVNNLAVFNRTKSTIMEGTTCETKNVLLQLMHYGLLGTTYKTNKD